MGECTMLKSLFLGTTVLLALTQFLGCTGKKATNAGSVEESLDLISIQKDQGINVGESEAIWVTGLKPVDAATKTLVIKVHRIQMDPLKNYPKQSWSFSVTGNNAYGSGTRTYVSEWGLLMGRGHNAVAGSSGLLYLASPAKGIIKLAEFPNISGTRVTPFAYLVKRGGKVYKFIAAAYLKSLTGTIFRVDRFLRNDATDSFTPVAPYEFSVPSMPNIGSVYKGFLYPCSVFDDETCTPVFYGGAGGVSANFFGVLLNQDVPPVAPPSGVVVPIQTQAPNANFVSTSHPTGGPWGTINDMIYSLSGDPDTGDVFKSFDTVDPNNFTSYDRVNQLVFRVTRSTNLQPDGTRCQEAGCKRSLVTVFDRSCFVDTTEINPSNGKTMTQVSNKSCAPNEYSKNLARQFTDVGKDLGPTSDLQNGCVAILGFLRTTEPGGADYVSPVYKACVRDRNNLDKGLVVIKLADVDGAAYMYNDFTGATLGDKPQYVLYDFTKRGVNGIKNAQFFWSPKIGFADTAIGIQAGFRCFGAGQTPPATFTPVDFENAFVPHQLPNCAGPDVNQVEFELKIIPKTRFTRFQSLTVTIER